MGPIIAYTVAIVILVLLSGFFSATETAYSSISKLKFKALAESDNRAARWAGVLGEQYDKLLTTILIGNNIVNIAASVIATLLFSKLIKEESISGVVSTVVITLVVLFVGEVAPKTMAKRTPEPVAIASAPFVLFLYYLFYPLNYILGAWQKFVTKFSRNKEGQVQITDDELITYVDEAQNTGSIDEEESELIKSAIEFDDLTIEDSLTPRVDIEALDVNCSVEKALEKFRETGFSRLPVYRGNIDNIIGLVNEKDFYKAYLAGEKKLRNIMTKNVIMVPASMKLPDILKKLQGAKTHLAVVMGEYGGTRGIITLEDILEELVGEIWDEHDDIVERIKKIDDNLYEVVGDLNIGELFEEFDLDEEADDYEPVTVGGLIATLLERAPKTNDKVLFKNLKLTVLKAEQNRVLKVMVEVLEKKEEEKEDSLLLKGIIGNSDEQQSED